jgi:CBS domain-containing protein
MYSGPREAFSIQPGATVAEAARLMTERRLRAIVVCAEGRPVGIVTAADLVRRVLHRQAPASTRVESVMTRDVIVARDDLSAIDHAVIMGERGLSSLPLVDGEGRLSSLLLFEDLLRLFAHGLHCLGRAAFGTEDRRGE